MLQLVVKGMKCKINLKLDKYQFKINFLPSLANEIKIVYLKTYIQVLNYTVLFFICKHIRLMVNNNKQVREIILKKNKFDTLIKLCICL